MTRADPITPETWSLARRAFLAVIDLPEPERSTAIDEACPDDATRELVRSLLLADRTLGDRDEPGPNASTAVHPALAWLGRDASPAIDGFEVGRPVGAGSSGLVFEAMQREPHRRVAIKILHPGVASPRAVARFRFEATLLARLDHPGIARVIAAGSLAEPDGRPYLVLEFVEGRPLLEASGERPVPEMLRLLGEIADAVHHAHTQGVIHRDLKPANILLTAGDRPKVLDFGIARLIADAEGIHTRHTVAGQALGTAAYMSPEQAGGLRPEDGTATDAGVDTRSDVYALGAIAYHLLAGRPPIPTTGRSLAEMLAAVRAGRIDRLGSIDPRLAGDIDAVVHRALSLEKADRYASAAELATEFRRAAEGEPVLARRQTAMQAARRIVRRHPRGAAIALLVAGAAVAGVVQLERSRSRAEASDEIARDVARVLLNEVMDRLGPLAGTLETRRRIVADLSGPVRRLAASRPGDAEVRFNLARLLDAEADTAGPEMPAGEIGALRREAVAILEDLAGAAPTDTRVLRTLSLLLVKAGDHAKAMGRRTEALAMYRRVLEIDAALSAAAPDDIELLDNLFWSDQRIFIELREEEPAIAAESRDRQERVVHELLARSPDRPGSIFAMLQFLADEPVPSFTPSTPPGVIRDAWAERLALGQHLITLSPNNRGHLIRHAGDLLQAAIVHLDANQPDEAAALHAQAAELYEPLFRTDPHDPMTLETAARLPQLGAHIAVVRGDGETALRLAQIAIDKRREALRVIADDQRPARLIELSGALARLAWVRCSLGLGDTRADEFLEIYRLVWREPIRPELTWNLVETATSPAYCGFLTPGSLSALSRTIRTDSPGSPIPDLLDAERLLAAGDAGGAAELFHAVAARTEFPDSARHAARRLGEVVGSRPD
jgi:tRNA A-37 threonylcarbamoyl transferase component Bud32/tetratricopeptide (TPR) repeat protein